jgi:hypothetical protein
MADDRLDSGLPLHLAFGLGSEAALLAGDEDLELVIRLRISNFGGPGHGRVTRNCLSRLRRELSHEKSQNQTSF